MSELAEVLHSGNTGLLHCCCDIEAEANQVVEQMVAHREALARDHALRQALKLAETGTKAYTWLEREIEKIKEEVYVKNN